MGKPLAGAVGVRRGVALVAGFAVLAGLAVCGGLAGASPAPTVAQVQARINQLTTQFDTVSVQLDQASQQLAAARSRLSQLRADLSHADARFQAAQANVAAAAAAAFESSGTTSIAGVLTAGDPSVVLQQGSLLMEMSGDRDAQTLQLLADARQLAGAEQQLQGTESGIAALQGQLAARKKSLGTLIASEKTTLASLTVPEQETVVSHSIGGDGTTTATYTGPTSTQAEKAVAFAYAQLGKPYQWGATGPDSFDCSGLVQAAWGAAGVDIPRDTYEQWAALPHIAASAIQLGDLLYYDSVGHVAIYVGDGYIIDAPQTGMDVQKIPMDNSWYAANFSGAARP
jgi:cell wall-associated NlpC family hydrolase